MSKWIPVKERPPALYVSVLVFKGAVYVGSWNGHHWCGNWRCGVGLSKFKHLIEKERRAVKAKGKGKK